MKVSKIKKVCNLILVDSSGSMFSKEEDVKGGLLSLFKDIKKDTGSFQHTIIISFNSDSKVLINTTNSKELEDSIADKYKSGGGTALYDAIGFGFSLVPSGYDGVFVNIVTDGEENSSKEFNSASVKKLIESKTEDKWGITFMGTTKEAITEAKNFGILNTLQFTNNSKGIQTTSTSRNYSRGVYMDSVYSGSITTGNLIVHDK